ncbi:hypothetical protein MRY87_05650 [bacterium]|nr:hypothetical protein [bacterium]
MKLHTTALFLFVFCIVGCSSQAVDPGSSLPSSIEVTSLSLQMSRKSLSKTEFEQFRLMNTQGDLFLECGTISGGRFTPAFQKLDRLTTGGMEAVENTVETLLRSANFRNESFDDPGDNSSLFDPGRYILTFHYRNREDGTEEEVHIETSMRAISAPSNGGERALHEMAEGIRSGVSFFEPICGNREFFGLRGKDYPAGRTLREKLRG